MPYFTIKLFPRRLRDRIGILAIQMHKSVAEIATLAIQAGLEAVENESKDSRSEG